MANKSGNDCKSCSMENVCKDSWAAWVFFAIGIIATVAVRVIVLVDVIDQSYGKLMWYVGVVGFILFFAYKYRALKNSSRIIRESGLLRKLSSMKKLNKQDYALVSQIICSQDNWKERINYFVIFALSAFALILALYIDLFHV